MLFNYFQRTKILIANSLIIKGISYCKKVTNICTSEYSAIHCCRWSLDVPFTRDCSTDGKLRPVNLSFATFVPAQEKVELPSIVILHGLFGSKTNWKSLAKVISLQTHSKVYTLDARNHGDSPHSNEFNYHEMANDVEHFMKNIGMSKAVIVGHSMGGRTAMLFSLNKPEMVHKLVIVDVSPASMPDSDASAIPKYFGAMKSSLKALPSGVNIHEARKLVDDFLAKTIKHVEIRQFLLTNLKGTKNGFNWQCNLDVLEKNFFSNINTFPSTSKIYYGPALFLCGGKSGYVKKDHHSQVMMQFPKAEIVYIPDAGHWVHSDKPSEFLEALKCFLLN